MWAPTRKREATMIGSGAGALLVCRDMVATIKEPLHSSVYDALFERKLRVTFLSVETSFVDVCPDVLHRLMCFRLLEMLNLLTLISLLASLSRCGRKGDIPSLAP